MIDRPLVLKSEQTGFEFALDPAKLTSMLVSTQPLQIDESRLRAYLTDLAAQIAVPARDARLRFDANTGAVSVIQSSQPGRELDIDATVAAVQNALASGAAEAPLAVAAVPPSVDMNRIAEMGIRELVASGSTYFAGSSASRVRNIEVAAEKFDGVVIPPDGIFSFNDIVRDVSSANGFEDSLVIWGDRTAVGVGGGVCQTSTTLFRAAYEGGFPIVQRTNHGYVVDWYGKPGLDATIFTPSVDFRFRNDTGAYLLIEPAVDAANGVITFNFYGTRPERVVTVGEPVITDVEDPEPPSYVVDESLETGEKKQVEWEKQGMTATVERTIVENGETRTDTLVSKYQPWRAVYLVGPGTEIPATPTPTPSAGGKRTACRRRRRSALKRNGWRFRTSHAQATARNSRNACGRLRGPQPQIDALAAQRAQNLLCRLPRDQLVQLTRRERRVVIGKKDAETGRCDRQLLVDIVRIVGAACAQALAQGVCAVHFTRLWVHPVHIFGVVVVGEARPALITELVAQIEPKTLPALIPPIIIDVKPVSCVGRKRVNRSAKRDDVMERVSSLLQASANNPLPTSRKRRLLMSA